MNELKNMLEYTGIDVEKLVDDYVNTLHENNNPRATREGTIIALKEYAQKKEWLIHQVMAMPGYSNLKSVGIITVPYIINSYNVRNKVSSIWSRLFNYGDVLLSKVDDNGKTVEDYVREELASIPLTVDINDLIAYSGKQGKSFDDFAENGYTRKSVKNKSNANQLINIFKGYTSARLTDEVAKEINDIVPDIRAASEMKTTRAFGKVIRYYGLEDKSAGSVYTKEYATDYCEIMKDGGTKYLFIVSADPIDYLKMSIGAFTSCHNINGGHWRSGTIAYMLDNVTLICYTIKLGNEIINPDTGEVTLGEDRPELFDKIHRQCFHWDENHRLIQSRVYPQGNEYNTDIYKTFRLEVQRRLSLANGWETDKWVNRKRKFTDFTRAGENSTNYADWSYSQYNANLSTPGTSTDPYSTAPFVIGAEPTCIICGNHHSLNGSMVCPSCRNRY